MKRYAERSAIVFKKYWPARVAQTKLDFSYFVSVLRAVAYVGDRARYQERLGIPTWYRRKGKKVITGIGALRVAMLVQSIKLFIWSIQRLWVLGIKFIERDTAANDADRTSHLCYTNCPSTLVRSCVAILITGLFGLINSNMDDAHQVFTVQFRCWGLLMCTEYVW